MLSTLFWFQFVSIGFYFGRICASNMSSTFLFGKIGTHETWKLCSAFGTICGKKKKQIDQ